MTNERAREVLQEQIDRYGQEYDAEGIEALEMAIKALEQQPCEDCISRQTLLEKAIIVPIAKVVTEDKVICRKIVFVEDIQKLPSVTPKTDALDNVKEKIDLKQYDFMGNKDYDEGIRFGLMLAYQIIDKYKAESEEEG